MTADRRASRAARLPDTEKQEPSRGAPRGGEAV